MFQRLSKALVSILCFAGLAAAQNPVRVGVSLPLTGPTALYGTEMKNSLEYLNREMGHGRIEFLFADDHCQGNGAAEAARHFVESDKVSAVTGLVCSEARVSAAPIYEQAGVVTISLSSLAPLDPSPLRYSVRPPDRLAAPILYQFLSRQTVSAALFDETPLAQELRAALEAEIPAGSAKIHLENFQMAETDVRPMLLNLRLHSPTALLIVTPSNVALARLVKQIRMLGWSVPIVSHVTPAHPGFLSEAGRLAEGAYFTSLPAASRVLTGDGEALFASYKREFGETKSGEEVFLFPALAYTALLAAIDHNTISSAKLGSGLFGSPLLSPFSFSPQGEILGVGYSYELNVLRRGRATKASGL